MSDIFVYGAADHGKYTIDIVERGEKHRVIGVIDDRADVGSTVYGYPVLGTGDDLRALHDIHHFEGGIVAVGDNYVRSMIAERITDALPNLRFVTAIHPSASIGRGVTIGEGSLLMAGAIVNGSSSVGRHCFIATKASLDHDSSMDDFSSLSPGVSTGGRVRIGAYSTISIGACVVHGVTVGEHTVVGAGSTVIADVPSYVTAYGTPCKAVRQRVAGSPYL